MRLVLGLIKGIVIGGLVGLGAYKLGMTGGWHWLTYGLIGVFIGLLVGRPIWSIMRDKDATIWTVVMKGILGYMICIILYAIVAKAWGAFDITISSIQEEPRNLYDWQPLFGGILGALYGGFVEFDDAAGDGDKKAS